MLVSATMMLKPRLPLSAASRSATASSAAAAAFAAVLGIGREHVHVPCARRQVLQLLQGHEHGRHVGRDGLGLVGERIADEPGGDAPLPLHHDRVAIGEGARLARGALAADRPRIAAGPAPSGSTGRAPGPRWRSARSPPRRRHRPAWRAGTAVQAACMRDAPCVARPPTEGARQPAVKPRCCRRDVKRYLGGDNRERGGPWRNRRRD